MACACAAQVHKEKTAVRLFSILKATAKDKMLELLEQGGIPGWQEGLQRRKSWESEGPRQRPLWLQRMEPQEQAPIVVKVACVQGMAIAIR